MTETRYLSPEEVVARFGGRIKVRTLANWRSAGDQGPPYLKLGGRIVYPLDELIEWERSRTTAPGDKRDD